MFNQLNLIEFFVEKEAKINARDSEGRSPFLNAVAAGHVDCARVLLKIGADFSAADLHMKTCLHIAVENEHLEMLSMLLESRAGVSCLNRGDLKDRVPLHYAAKTRDIKVTLERNCYCYCYCYCFITAGELDITAPLHRSDYNRVEPL